MGRINDKRIGLGHRNATAGQGESLFSLRTKRKPLKSALKHPNGAELSNVQIAEHCGVGEHLVRKLRESLFPTSPKAKSISRKGKDGRTINTTNIGSTASDEEDETEVVETVRNCGQNVSHGIQNLPPRWTVPS